jgi:hypothetical protein
LFKLFNKSNWNLILKIMRVTKDVQSNLGLLNTIRNINKLKNPSHNINLANNQYSEKK